MRPDRGQRPRLWVLLELQGKDKLARATRGTVSVGHTNRSAGAGGTQVLTSFVNMNGGP